MKNHDWYFTDGPPAAKPSSSQEMLERLQTSLLKRGYSPNTVQRYLSAWNRFRMWLRAENKELPAATEQDVRLFLSRRIPVPSSSKAAPRQDSNARAALAHLLAVVRGPSDQSRSVGSVTPIQQELADFADYLKRLCGLSESTCIYRIRYVGEFLAAMFPQGPIAPGELRPQGVMRWVAQRGESCKRGTASAIASSVRRYFRFCQSNASWPSP